MKKEHQLAFEPHYGIVYFDREAGKNTSESMDHFFTDTNFANMWKRLIKIF